jgi:vitamin B12 transporter
VNSVIRYTDARLLFTGDSGFPGLPNPQSTHGVISSPRARGGPVAVRRRIKNYFWHESSQSPDLGLLAADLEDPMEALHRR